MDVAASCARLTRTQIFETCFYDSTPGREPVFFLAVEQKSFCSLSGWRHSVLKTALTDLKTFFFCYAMMLFKLACANGLLPNRHLFTRHEAGVPISYKNVVSSSKLLWKNRKFILVISARSHDYAWKHLCVSIHIIVTHNFFYYNSVNTALSSVGSRAQYLTYLELV